MKTLLRDLLTLCETGDNEAVAELVRRFRPWALDFALAITDDRDLAEDAVQEAFITAIGRLRDLRDADAFPGWFRQIIRTRAGRIMRSRRELTGSQDELTVATDGIPQDAIEANELRKVVREALSSLSNARKDAAELFYFEELSCAGISDRLGVPQGTVKRRLHDARAQLRSMLLGYIREEEPAAEESGLSELPL